MSDEYDEDKTALVDHARLASAVQSDSLTGLETGERNHRLQQLESGERDQRLQRLHEQRAIDTEQYVEATKQQHVKFKHPRFEHLPDREPLYNLLGALDEGGMGEVRIARDPYLDRRVAIKLLKLDKIAQPLNVERFLREAQITAKLDHPNVIPIYSLHAENDGRASFAMKLIHGVTLTDIVVEVRDAYDNGKHVPERWQLRRRLELFLRICDAMSYAHDLGVIHRDLKPANIMVGEYNEVYVMDWGLAKTLEDPEGEADETAVWAAQNREGEPEDSVETQHGAMIGTPVYMAPEQALGRHDLVGPHSDQFALGAILFELVVLSKMNDGRSIRDAIINAIQRNARPLEPYKGLYRIAPELRAIIERATAEKSTERYSSVAELATDLRRFLDDEEVAAHPDGPVRKAQRWMAHNRGITFALVLALVTVSAAAMITSLVQQNQATRRQHEATKEQQVRERQLTLLQNQVSERAHAADSQFLRFQLLVNRLAIAAEQLLTQGVRSDAPMYLAADYDAGNGPPDFAESPLYNKEISVTSPVFVPAPDADHEALEPTMRMLLPLTTQFQSLFLDSRIEAKKDEADDLWQTIAVDGVPGRWAFVGLAEGVHISYPGKTGYEDDYDPRERPWYKRGEGKRAPVWGAPYVDAQGQGIVLPCVVEVAPQGRSRGVAGFEVALDFVQERYMEPAGAVEETYLLDGEARVLATSKGAAIELDVDAVENLPQIAQPTVVERIRNGTSGVFVEGEGDAATVFVISRLPTLDWYYVARAPLTAVLASSL